MNLSREELNTQDASFELVYKLLDKLADLDKKFDDQKEINQDLKKANEDKKNINSDLKNANEDKKNINEDLKKTNEDL